jgi:hypothetical protein
MTEYYIELKNLTTGKTARIRKYLTPVQVEKSTIGKIDKHNVQLVNFFEIK